MEGTLVDCVRQTLLCWQETLQGFGHAVEIKTLQAYSGLDGREMLNRLLPRIPSKKKTQILKHRATAIDRNVSARSSPARRAHLMSGPVGYNPLGRRVG
jgi:hypothetical protein